MSLITNVQKENNISTFLYSKLNNETQTNFHFCTTTTYIRISTALLLRAGYVLVQLGSIPVNDVNSIILHNILDITVTICSYGLMGYAFSFGHLSIGGFIGASTSFYRGYFSLDEVMYGFSACLIGSAVITTMMSGRILPMAAAGTSVIYGGLLQPIIMHWAWHTNGWMAKRVLHGTRYSVKDHGGGLVLHLNAGVAALWGSIVLGRRLIKLKDLHESSLGTASAGTTFIGYILIFIGLISFTLPNQKYENDHIPDDYIGIILLNSLMALTAGLFIVIMQCLCFGRVSGYWVLLKCLQGSLAGLVTVTSGIDVYDHFISLFLAALGSVLFYSITIVLERMFYEDYCNIIPIHLFCSIIGAMFPPLLGNRENLGSAVPFELRIYHTLWQILCTFTIIAWSSAFYFPLFLFMRGMGFLANKHEEINHQRSLNVMKNVATYNSFWRIFTFSEFAPYVEPTSEHMSNEILTRLKQQHESRREVLEAAMARKHKKRDTELTRVIQQPAVPAKALVKNMGILDEERYPLSYDDVMEERQRDFVYAPSDLSSPLSGPPREMIRKVTVDFNAPSTSRKRQLVNVDVHRSRKSPETPRKKISPRKRPKTRRRRRKLRRLDSDAIKTKRRD